MQKFKWAEILLCNLMKQVMKWCNTEEVTSDGHDPEAVHLETCKTIRRLITDTFRTYLLNTADMLRNTITTQQPVKIAQ